MDYKDGKEEKSKYNEASLQILRIHDLDLKIENVLHNPEIYNKTKRYHYLLDSIWRELSADVGKRPDKKYKRYCILKNSLLRAKCLREHNESKKYLLLDERHIFLKSVQEKVGKGGVYSDGREDNFD